jgi:hypothetical protein
MKKFAAIISIALITLTTVSIADAATKVFLIAGQSNAAGVGGYSGYLGPNHDSYPPWTTPDYYRGADDPCPAAYQTVPGVQFWNYTPDSVGGDLMHYPGVGNAWITLQNGYGHRTDQFGPELSFGKRLKELFPSDEIYIVKYAMSGTSLGGLNEWNPNGSSTNLFNAFKNRVTAAVNNLIGQSKNPVISGMIWMQGENDTTVTSYANAYAGNLANLVSKVRTFNKASNNTEFVCGRITMDAAMFGGTDNTNTVRNAQGSISNSVGNASCINTDDLQKAYYEHYGTQGQIDLGIRFANEFAPVPEPSAWILIGTCLIGLAGMAWKKRK